MNPSPIASEIRFLPREKLPSFVEQLCARFARLVGPTVRDGAVVYAEIDSAQQLPMGYRDCTEAGRYRLEQHDTERSFDWVSTAQGIKPWLFQPEETLWTITPHSAGFQTAQQPALSTVLLGARACDLAALKLLDQHFIGGDYPDPRYRARRESLFIIAVNCQRALETCFCLSTGDGPEVTEGHDLVLDELDDGYLFGAGSERGAQLLAELRLALKLAPANEQQLTRARAMREPAKRQLRKMPDAEQLNLLWQAELDESRWQEVAERCLTCGNCTAVCPTCFCFRIDNEASFDGETQSQVRRWDSCFSNEHSYLTGNKIVHQTPVHKYRQWLMHKLVYWQQQYGRSGCSGCGRCITWCPAAIDLVAEAERLSSPANETGGQHD